MHQNAERPRKNNPNRFGFIQQQETEASNVEPQYAIVDPAAVDPTYYSTLPKDQIVEATDQQDDIYSGLMSTKYNKNTADKSRLLADINYNRKQQTKIFTQNRRTQ